MSNSDPELSKLSIHFTCSRLSSLRAEQWGWLLCLSLCPPAPLKLWAKTERTRRELMVLLPPQINFLYKVQKAIYSPVILSCIWWLPCSGSVWLVPRQLLLFYTLIWFTALILPGQVCQGLCHILGSVGTDLREHHIVVLHSTESQQVKQIQDTLVVMLRTVSIFVLG